MKWRLVPLILIAVVYLAPLYWMGVGAFQPARGITKMPPEFFPTNPTLDNFAKIAERADRLPSWVLSTLIVTGGIIAGALAVNGLAAYAFAMFKFKGASFLLMVFLGSLMITRYAILIPTFVLLKWYHISGYLAVIITSIFWPVGIFLANNYFKTIPASLIESARMDGARETTILALVVAPLCKPLVALMVVSKGLEAMQDYLWQFLLLQDQKKMTLLVGLVYSIYERYQLSGHTIDFGHQNAVGVVLFFPLLVIFLAANRYFISGLTTAAVKE